MRETLTIDTRMPLGTCAVCRTEPRAERLDMDLKLEGQPYRVTICRPCLAEFAPGVLAAIEKEAAA